MKKKNQSFKKVKRFTGRSGYLGASLAAPSGGTKQQINQFLTKKPTIGPTVGGSTMRGIQYQPTNQNLPSSAVQVNQSSRSSTPAWESNINRAGQLVFNAYFLGQAAKGAATFIAPRLAPVVETGASWLGKLGSWITGAAEEVAPVAEEAIEMGAVAA